MAKIISRQLNKAEGSVRIVIEHEDGHVTDHKIHPFNTDNCPTCGKTQAGAIATGVDVKAAEQQLLDDAHAYEKAWADFVQAHG